MEKKKVKDFLEKYIYFPLIAVFITILIQQLFFKGNEREKYKIEFKKELLIKQYPYLKKMKRIAELDNEISSVTYMSVFLDKNGKVYGEDKKGITVSVPSIVIDKKSQKEWELLVADIQNNKDKIDLDLYKIFKDIVKIARNHPFPSKNKLYEIEKSGWTNPDIIGRWENLNRYLMIKIKNKENFIE